jgi:predicted alpha/beta-fold hydrolase
MNASYSHSTVLWQPLLVLGMKRNLVSTINPFHHILYHLGNKAIDVINYCASIVDLDAHFFTPMNNFNSLNSFYKSCVPTINDVMNLKTPLLAIHAADDPLVHAETQPATEFVTKYENDKQKGSRMISFITESGGHIGWSVGMFPWVHKWIFQNSVALEFCEAICETKLEHK